jgi:hypothetical protein
MRAEACLVLSLLLTACGGGNPASGAPRPLDVDAEAADRVTDVITEALRADARMQRADSLYDAGAIIVADGERRTSVPRYAGISSGGQVAVGSSQKRQLPHPQRPQLDHPHSARLTEAQTPGQEDRARVPKERLY